MCSDARHYAAKYFDGAHARNEPEQSNSTDFVRSRRDFDPAGARWHSTGGASHRSLYPGRREQWRPATELVGLRSITATGAYFRRVYASIFCTESIGEEKLTVFSL